MQARKEAPMEFRIKEARENAGYSQKELAEIIGVAPNTFHGYESGKHDPKSDLLVKIANACNVSTDFLLGATKELQEKTKKSPSVAEAAPGDEQMIALYRQLNPEGQEKLLDYADDLVASGKYIKSDPAKLNKAKDA